MFDISFTELMVIGVVALVVIGPERLPGVARTAGALLGRLQRYVSDVKADVQREMRLEEMKKLQTEIESQARGIENQVRTEMQSAEKSIESAVTPLAAVPEQLVATRPLAEVMEEQRRATEPSSVALPSVGAAGAAEGAAPAGAADAAETGSVAAPREGKA